MVETTKLYVAGTLLCLCAVGLSIYVFLSLMNVLKNIDTPGKKEGDGERIFNQIAWYGSMTSSCLGCCLLVAGAMQKSKN